MKLSVAKLACLIFVLAAAKAQSQTLNWASLTQSEIVDNGGNPLDNTFVFELGAFANGFVPDETNISNWQTNWRVFQAANYSYDPDPSKLGYFTGTQDVQSVPAYSSLFEGLKAYIWIRNDTATEHFLASTSSDAWRFPLLVPGCCPNGEGPTWSVSDLKTDSPIWGGQLGNEGSGVHSVSGSFEIQTYVVPETSSSMLIAIGLGFAVTRRRRSAA